MSDDTGNSPKQDVAQTVPTTGGDANIPKQNSSYLNSLGDESSQPLSFASGVGEDAKLPLNNPNEQQNDLPLNTVSGGNTSTLPTSDSVGYESESYPDSVKTQQTNPLYQSTPPYNMPEKTYQASSLQSEQSISGDQGMQNESIPQASNAQVDSTPFVPPNQTPIAVSPRSKVPKILIFIALISFVTMLATAGYYFFTNPGGDNGNLDEAAQFTPTTEPTIIQDEGKEISFSSANLINAVTVLIAQDAYSISYTGSSTTDTGCATNGTMEATKSLDNYYSKLTAVYASESAGRICVAESKLEMYFETYEIDGVRYNRQAEDQPYAVLDGESKVVTALSPSEAINQFLPYPTLLTVTKAVEKDNGLKTVEAKVDNVSPGGTFSFVLDEKNQILSFSHQTKLVTATSSTTSMGEVDISYDAVEIVAPTIESEEI
ncbi:hypothetical protein IPM62_00955 [Candidatus Woesebacteria bacterium]|nr:MAG: hypothetical protein IPM62_00955 [Candidatus Woesebacteria bacterium]